MVKLIVLGVVILMFTGFFAMSSWKSSKSLFDLEDLAYPRLKGLYLEKSTRDIIQGMLDWEETVPKSETIFVFPFPSLFYFATGRKNPTKFAVYSIGPDYGGVRDEPDLVNDLIKKTVKWVLVAQMRGSRLVNVNLPLGVDYSWIEAVKTDRALRTENDSYPILEKFLFENYESVKGAPRGFWLLRLK